MNSKEFVNQNLDYWEEVFSNQEWGKYPPIELVRFVAKNFYRFSDRKSIKILELGSGPGPNLWYMAREGFCVYGIEGSQSACESAYGRLSVEGLQNNIGEIKAGDYFEKLDEFADNYFDAIIDVESLYCNPYERTKDIVLKSFTKLKSGGKMFSMTFANKEWLSEDEDIAYHAINSPEIRGYFRYTTREDIDTIYKNSLNKIDTIEMLELHTNNGKSRKEWLIELTKI
ncbi:MAG: class I SAM-dependent methyltransferase [Campylobacterales bacterium]|nr:class I SAM-dependent methyltransferase [Campylobacterales bacterium]